ncbi:MAG: hypothetical protein ACFE8L_13510 [Candidatus Hodarchaeota archaeon]
MSSNIISKVLEINNCDKETLIKALYKAKFWETIKPTKKLEAEFTAPNILYTKVYDEIDLIKVPIEMEGELVLTDKGEQEKKGRLIELNVRNNKDVRTLEGRLRIKEITTNKTKLGVFINSFTLSSDFLNLIGKSAAELTLRRKISDMTRNLEKFCKTNSLSSLL